MFGGFWLARAWHNGAMDRNIAYLAGIALASEGGTAPDWVQLTPPGPVIEARDGRTFRLSDPQALKDAFYANEADLPVDVEHASETRPPQGLDAPAVGWIKDVEVRSGAIWGRVDWTEQGRAWIEAKAYRYLSPAFLHLRDGEMIALKSAGLTNNPAFKMAALASAEHPPKKEDKMEKSVLDALGLADDRTAPDVVAAVASLKTELATATAAAKSPDPTLYVSRAQYDATVGELEKLRTAEAARQDALFTGAVDAGVASGKIAPAARDGYLAMARAIGLEAFDAQIAAMPVIASPAGDAPSGGVKTATANAEEIAIAAQLGLSSDDYTTAKAKYEGAA